MIEDMLLFDDCYGCQCPILDASIALAFGFIVVFLIWLLVGRLLGK